MWELTEQRRLRNTRRRGIQLGEISANVALQVALYAKLAPG